MKITEKLKFKGNGIFWCLAGIFLTGALPLLTNYCLNSSEVPYQLVRIENMKDYLSAGIFQMAMPVNWQYEHGTAGLDGNLFWLLPVLLRMTGAALESVYRMFLICIYAVTVCFSYKTLEEGFQNKKNSGDRYGTVLLGTVVSGCLVWKSRHWGSVRLRFPAGVITVSGEGSRAEKRKTAAMASSGHSDFLAVTVFFCGSGSGNASVSVLLRILSQTIAGKRRLADIGKGSSGNTVVQFVVSAADAKISCGIS